jgi:hypothetical protein
VKEQGRGEALEVGGEGGDEEATKAEVETEAGHRTRCVWSVSIYVYCDQCHSEVVDETEAATRGYGRRRTRAWGPIQAVDARGSLEGPRIGGLFPVSQLGQLVIRSILQSLLTGHRSRR